MPAHHRVCDAGGSGIIDGLAQKRNSAALGCADWQVEAAVLRGVNIPRAWPQTPLSYGLAGAPPSVSPRPRAAR